MFHTFNAASFRTSVPKAQTLMQLRALCAHGLPRTPLLRTRCRSRPVDLSQGARSSRPLRRSQQKASEVLTDASARRRYDFFGEDRPQLPCRPRAPNPQEVGDPGFIRLVLLGSGVCIAVSQALYAGGGLGSSIRPLGRNM